MHLKAALQRSMPHFEDEEVEDEVGLEKEVACIERCHGEFKDVVGEAFRRCVEDCIGRGLDEEY